MSQTTTPPITHFRDAYALQSKPDKNFNHLGTMALQDGAFGYLFCANPVPPRSNVLSAKLRVKNVEAWNGTVTLTLARVSSKYKANRLTWNNRPGVMAGFSKTISKTNAAAHTTWEFDVTDWVQAVVDGDDWYGWRIDATGTTRKRIYSSNTSNADFKPQLEITWGDEPVSPSDVQPRGGLAVSVLRPVFRFDFTDVAGSRTMQAFQVQFNSTSSGHSVTTGFSAPTFDTGTVYSSLPQYDSSVATPGGTWGGIAAGGSVWWTVRVQDDAGLWSGWSLPANFTRTGKPAVTLNNPTTVAEESTPPVSWTMAGQVGYQLTISDPLTRRKLWDTGYVTSGVQTVTVREGVLKTVGAEYLLELVLYDNVARANAPNDPPYMYVSQLFTYSPTGSVSPTTSLTVDKDSATPTYTLTWSAGTMPDGFAVMMDGQVVAPNAVPADFLVPGQTDQYRFQVLKVAGRQSHTFEVARVVNGRQSSGNPTVTVNVRNVAPWLMETDGSNAIMFLDPEVSPELAEESDVLYPQDAPPVLITQSQWGYVGTIQGVLTDMNQQGLTARELRDRLKAMRKKVGATFYLLWQDEAIECYIYNVKIEQVGNADGSTDYPVSVGFVQTDYV